MPKEIFDFGPRENWDKEWLGTLAQEDFDDNVTPKFSVLRAFSPYAIVIGLLIITRIIEPLQKFLTGDSATLDLGNYLAIYMAVTSLVKFKCYIRRALF